MISEKIVQKRTELSLSQEQLAERLCVSRSAVAKWETGKGLPDIENIKALAGVFQITIDELLDASDKKMSCTPESSPVSTNRVIPAERALEPYYGKKCSVSLSGWNNGFEDGYILGEDKDYLFYLIPRKKEFEVGAIRKSAVVSVTEEKERKPVKKDSWPKPDRDYFVGKLADIHLKDENLITSFFFEKEFTDVPVLEFSEENVTIAAGKEFRTEDVIEITSTLGWDEK